MTRVQIALFVATAVLAGACAHDVDDRSDAVERETPQAMAVLDGTTRHLIQSRFVDQTFSIDVWQPAGVPGPLPVVYVLDGNTMFGMAHQMVLPMFYFGDVPPVVVVGIGYRVDSPFEVVARRSRDLLPTPDSGFSAYMAKANFPVPENFQTGRADDFLAFVEQELKPLIASHYPVDSGDETLVGYSYGGTLAFHALINHPGSFERYVIGSPVLARDEGDLIQDEARYAVSNRSLAARVFLSAGEYETENGILPSAQEMMKTLRSRDYEGLELKTHVFLEETHESGVGATISRGLRAVFGTWPKKPD